MAEPSSSHASRSNDATAPVEEQFVKMSDFEMMDKRYQAIILELQSLRATKTATNDEDEARAKSAKKVSINLILECRWEFDISSTSQLQNASSWASWSWSVRISLGNLGIDILDTPFFAHDVQSYLLGKLNTTVAPHLQASVRSSATVLEAYNALRASTLGSVTNAVNEIQEASWQSQPLEVFTNDLDKISALRTVVISKYPELSMSLARYNDWFMFVEDLSRESHLPKYPVRARNGSSQKSGPSPQKQSVNVADSAVSFDYGMTNLPNPPSHHIPITKINASCFTLLSIEDLSAGSTIDRSVKWLADTSASVHVAHSKSYFVPGSLVDARMMASTANGNVMATQMGNKWSEAGGILASNKVITDRRIVATCDSKFRFQVRVVSSAANAADEETHDKAVVANALETP
ncbi:hypothetical protein BROUX41_000097 [Berkeleyomyces rouxiae]|uniref:uncharacterized protein n=1 Tax=Berkeleyomyces rouxiae TaxID=2035830 RepID=UPI003B7B253A